MADIEASPRTVLETLFSISGFPWNRRSDERGNIRPMPPVATREDGFPGQKWVPFPGFA
ncbi:MAG TPA: hypothetical protein VKR55_17480 [Bradyrhizobium sp.]|uniref:hypothetical protein n=1 Tax=Bradyrhizobium sp. TaxID=376 RepID=UPI002B98FDEF|nr:hypothetical protein [Bradyrhizobium sp.]HLZ03921.1 hypothetical protein [Bradyrhizobium sp.]